MKSKHYILKYCILLIFIISGCSDPDEKGINSKSDESISVYDEIPRAIARLNVVPYQIINSNFKVGVVAFHKDEIDYVEFSISDGVNTVTNTVTTMTNNPRTSVNEYWITVDPNLFNDGEIVINASAVPKTGLSFKRDISVSLYANSGGAFNNIETFYVKPSTGSDTNPGTLTEPFETIIQAIYALGPNADHGKIVLLEEGTYEFGKINNNIVARNNSGWIVIEGESSLNRDNIIIISSSSSLVRPYVGKIKFKHLSFDFTFISQVYGELFWFDDCKWFRSTGWGLYPSNLLPHVNKKYYVTDSYAYDSIYGFTFAKLVRGCNLEKISGDVFQNSEFIVNSTVDNVDGALLEHHTDLYQMWGEMDNTIVYKVVANNLIETQSLFLQPTYLNNLGEPQHKMINTAFVDMEINNIKQVNGSNPNWGGPPFSQMQSQFSHIIFKNVRIPWQRFVFRNEWTNNNQAWQAKDIIFDNSELHWSTYDSYIDSTSSDYTGPPSGISFINCYSGPLN